MTEENRRLNISEELERADAALEATRVLLQERLLSDCVSRLYYYLFYNVRALLLTKGIEPRSHEGAMRLYSLHFIKNGPLPASASHLFARLMKYREEADYNPSYMFEADDVEGWIGEAIQLAHSIRSIIRNEGLTDIGG